MISIVGIEVTQGIQFFDLNGQGSGSAADNSRALFSQKKTLVRVYAAEDPPPPSRPGAHPGLAHGDVLGARRPRWARDRDRRRPGGRAGRLATGRAAPAAGRMRV